MKKQATLTQLEFARQGIVTDKMQQVATTEKIDPEILRQRIAEGTAVICHNNRHQNGVPLAVGKGLRTKVNANIGTSKDDTSIDKELAKAHAAVAAGADAIMDLSTGGPIDEIRAAGGQGALRRAVGRRRGALAGHRRVDRHPHRL